MFRINRCCLTLNISDMHYLVSPSSYTSSANTHTPQQTGQHPQQPVPQPGQQPVPQPGQQPKQPVPQHVQQPQQHVLQPGQQPHSGQQPVPQHQLPTLPQYSPPTTRAKTAKKQLMFEAIQRFI